MYHVGVSNIYELLDDENNPGGAKRVSAPPAKQEATGATKATKEPVKKETPPAKGTGSPVKTDRRPPRTSEPTRTPPADGEAKGDRPPRRNFNRDGPRERGGDRPQGERRERREHDRKESEKKAGETSAPRKRVFDRKSGSGRGKEIKKGGGGRGNWGKEGSENWDEPTTAAPEDTVESKVAVAAAAETGGEAKPEGEGAAEKSAETTPKETKPRELTEEEKKKIEEDEKEAKQMTLDEYLKSKESKTLPGLPPPRKAGEGVDKKEQQKWGQYKELTREEEEAQKVEQEKEKEKKSKRQVVPLDSVLNVKTPRTPKEDRGDRPPRDRPEGGRSGRGGGSRGGNRGGKRGGGDTKHAGGSAPTFKQDDSSFPTLSAATKA